MARSFRYGGRLGSIRLEPKRRRRGPLGFENHIGNGARLPEDLRYFVVSRIMIARDGANGCDCFWDDDYFLIANDHVRRADDLDIRGKVKNHPTT